MCPVSPTDDERPAFREVLQDNLEPPAHLLRVLRRRSASKRGGRKYAGSTSSVQAMRTSTSTLNFPFLWSLRVDWAIPLASESQFQLRPASARSMRRLM